MKIQEVASFQVSRLDDVRTFIGPVNAALVFSEHLHGGSMFMQVQKDAGLMLRIVGAVLELAAVVIEDKFRMMDFDEDVKEQEARDLVELACYSVQVNARQPEYVAMLAAYAGDDDPKELVIRAKKMWNKRKASQEL